jgi:hypothetical protein
MPNVPLKRFLNFFIANFSKMKLQLMCVALAISTVASSQTLRGKVFDGQTRQALPYANLGIRGKSIGGITDGSGSFSIDLSKAAETDSLVISYVGYRSLSFLVGTLAVQQNQVFYLSPGSKLLDEVVITDKQEVIVVGNASRSNRHTGWGDFGSSRGRALGLLIPAPEFALKVNKVVFHLHENEFDSIRLRINLLQRAGTSAVAMEGQSKNIFVTVRQRKGWIEVPIEETLVMRDELVVALEWVDAWGAKPRSLEDGGSYIFTISVARSPGQHYRREHPDEPITLTPGELTPSIYLACVALKK